MTKTYINGPAIAAIRGTSRMTENEHIRAGHYGPVFWRAGVAFVSAAAVGRRIGQPLTGTQIELVASGRPRILVVDPPEPEITA